MGWEMLQYTLRVVDHIQVNSPDDDDDDDDDDEKGFTNSGAIKQLFIDNWLSLFEMTSIVRENPSTDEDFRGTPEVAEDQRQLQNAYLAGRTGRGDHCSVA
ncbi:hypothetical protein M752DRAFT_339414 [Aspergillus phoenicis ATCC 13157]|nr:hypothetical protein M752DRAFT_339414 [Aspergillus phoenicis ATCC 13157]